jgi:hypothetical protein
MSSTKPVIFISYCHRDEPKHPGAEEVKWLTHVQSFLQPAMKHGVFDLWTDEHIPGGSEWKVQIAAKLVACDVCILLVSRHSLNSHYCINIEIETIRQRQEAGEKALIYPIILSPVPRTALTPVKHLNLRPKDGSALSGFLSSHRDSEMSAIVDEIVDLLGGKSATTVTPKPEPTKVPQFVHITGLPETAYERLVGRDDELKRLDDAWADAKTSILSLIAEGGAGKSALVNEWLARMQADGYRGAEAVLGWSFYSQGSKERATSAEEFLNWAIDKLGIKLETTSATAKGEAIAEALAKRRVLLVLDGVEPLQHGLDKQQGELKDQGLRALLRRFAAMPPAAARGLVVLTSRLPVKDIARWNDGAAPVVDVEELSETAGAALLRDNGVWGTDRELAAAARDFGGHPLALGLLASFLTETQRGDVRRRDHVRAYLADKENPRHDHARRVMESYEREWLAGQPVAHAIMHMVGLFDRPASGDCLRALRQAPAIDGLAGAVVGLDEGAWQRAVARLREVRLLAPPDPAAPGALDAHPLVREWFGERLRETNEAAWKAAHGRLYEHLRDTTKEGKTPTLEDLAPLYQAIAHGCRAGRHQEALDEIYAGRICRQQPDGEIAFYASKKLGALGSNLASVSWFFEEPYAIPVATLTPENRSWVLGEAAFYLRAQGRIAEALLAMRAVAPIYEKANHWRNAAAAAANLSQAELLVGEIAAAVATAELSLAHADRSGHQGQMMANRTTYADALQAAGRHEDAARSFADAEQSQKLYSLWGYRYCDLVLARGDHAVARDRATQTLALFEEQYDLLSRALDELTLGRAHLGLGLATIGAQGSAIAGHDDARTAHARLGEAIDGLRASGQSDDLPRGLLARAAFRRSVGDWDGSARDLDEVEEIAEPAPMRLYLCDMALERARIAFARIEAFAPLNGLIDDGPSKPGVPSEAERNSQQEEVATQLGIAAEYIEKCGYHRRDEELAELQAVLQGKRAFAGLPPRV